MEESNSLPASTFSNDGSEGMIAPQPFGSVGESENENSRDSSFKVKYKRKSTSEITAAQAQCYERLTELLEKSQRYTNLLCDRLERDESSFTLLLKTKDVKRSTVENKKQMKAEVVDSSPANGVVSAKKRGRPPKRKAADDVDQVVPSAKKMKLDQTKHEGPPDSPHSSTSSQNEKELYQQSPPTDEENQEIVSYKQPVLLTGGVLRKYQLDGVSWLMKLYVNGVNGILADEMGLGKTIQCISLIADLVYIGVPGPFLVCGPLSTLVNWVNEFKSFAPQVPCLMYYGSKDERRLLLSSINKSHQIQGHNLSCRPVVVTSYEVAIKDQSMLGRIKWNLMIVDEGHRIKNSECRLIRELKKYDSSHRILLTGTPLQNNLSELWTLLNFLIPEIFSSTGSFETWFDVNYLENVDDANKQIVLEEKKSNTLSKIHQILAPFMLRRLKSDVDIIIPPKKELLVIAPFAEQQRLLYRSIIDKTIAQLVSTTPKLNKENESPEVDDIESCETSKKLRTRKKKVDYKLAFEEENEEFVENEDTEDSLFAWAKAVVDVEENSTEEVSSNKPKMPPIQLRNMLSLLRKCCNHPFLLQHFNEENSAEQIAEDLVTESGKLKLMDRMLARLKKDGHRVLIFSQSTKLLDILEDYCDYRSHTYCRLDGAMKLSDRQQQIQKFNEEDIFLFLLSTRAGGLGINLTKADTVIIYDSDWNPQCDLQAQDRCHRIGQVNPVVIYRLVAGGSVDQKIVERATAKRKLEKMIIHKDKFKSTWDSSLSDKSQVKLVDLQDLVSILEEKDYQDVIKNDELSEEDLEKLLDRSDIQQIWEDRKAGKIPECKVEGASVTNELFKVIEDCDDTYSS